MKQVLDDSPVFERGKLVEPPLWNHKPSEDETNMIPERLGMFDIGHSEDGLPRDTELNVERVDGSQSDFARHILVRCNGSKFVSTERPPTLAAEQPPECLASALPKSAAYGIWLRHRRTWSSLLYLAPGMTREWKVETAWSACLRNQASGYSDDRIGTARTWITSVEFK